MDVEFLKKRGEDRRVKKDALPIERKVNNISQPGMGWERCLEIKWKQEMDF